MKVNGARRELQTYPFQMQLTARFSDLDPQHHVNNVVVAEYYQESRIAFHRDLLGPNAERPQGARILVAHHAMDYLAEIHYPGSVVIGVGLGRIGTSSYSLVSGMFQGELCVGLASTVLVNADAQGPRALPDALRTLLGSRMVPEAARLERGILGT